MGIERLARHTGLDRGIHIIGIDRENGVHILEINRYAPMRRIHMPLKRGAGAKGDDRHAILRANAHDLLHLGRITRTKHRIGGLVGQPCGGMRMLVAQGLPGFDPFTEMLF